MRAGEVTQAVRDSVGGVRADQGRRLDRDQPRRRRRCIAKTAVDAAIGLVDLLADDDSELVTVLVGRRRRHARHRAARGAPRARASAARDRGARGRPAAVPVPGRRRVACVGRAGRADPARARRAPRLRAARRRARSSRRRLAEVEIRERSSTCCSTTRAATTTARSGPRSPSSTWAKRRRCSPRSRRSAAAGRASGRPWSRPRSSTARPTCASCSSTSLAGAAAAGGDRGRVLREGRATAGPAPDDEPGRRHPRPGRRRTPARSCRCTRSRARPTSSRGSSASSSPRACSRPNREGSPTRSTPQLLDDRGLVDRHARRTGASTGPKRTTTTGAQRAAQVRRVPAHAGRARRAQARARARADGGIGHDVDGRLVDVVPRRAAVRR